MRRAKLERSSESDIATVVIAWLEALGADVYQEVEIPGGRADIVARVRAELWIVETKTSVSLALIEQAMERRRHAHRVYIAAPMHRAKAGLALCTEVGIGMIAVDINGGVQADREYDEPIVQMRAESRRWNRRPVALADKLEPGHKTHARAGTSSGGHWTPFKRTIERLAAAAAAHPGILFKAAVDGIEHHYRTNAGARTSLAAWIRSGKVPGVRIADGKLWPTDPVTPAPSHAIQIDSRGIDLELEVGLEHRWRCSCGDTGDWTSRARAARRGGLQHQRAAERGATISHVPD